MLSEPTVSPSDREAFVAIIRRNASTCCKSSTTFSTSRRLRLARHRSNWCVQSAGPDQRRRQPDATACAQQGLTLAISYQSNVPEEIVTDRLLFRQALINVVRNGIKFTERREVKIAICLLPTGLTANLP